MYGSRPGKPGQAPYTMSFPWGRPQKTRIRPVELRRLSRNGRHELAGSRPVTARGPGSDGDDLELELVDTPWAAAPGAAADIRLRLTGALSHESWKKPNLNKQVHTHGAFLSSRPRQSSL